MLFCWARHVKAGFVKVDTDVKANADLRRNVQLKQTGERILCRREDVLRQARERTRDARFFAKDTHALVHLTLHM